MSCCAPVTLTHTRSRRQFTPRSPSCGLRGSTVAASSANPTTLGDARADAAASSSAARSPRAARSAPFAYAPRPASARACVSTAAQNSLRARARGSTSCNGRRANTARRRARLRAGGHDHANSCSRTTAYSPDPCATPARPGTRARLTAMPPLPLQQRDERARVREGLPRARRTRKTPARSTRPRFPRGARRRASTAADGRVAKHARGRARAGSMVQLVVTDAVSCCQTCSPSIWDMSRAEKTCAPTCAALGRRLRHVRGHGVTAGGPGDVKIDDSVSLCPHNIISMLGWGLGDDRFGRL